MSEESTRDAQAIQHRLEKMSQQFVKARNELETLWQQVKALPDDGQGKRDIAASSILGNIHHDGYVTLATHTIEVASANLNTYTWIIGQKERER